MTRPSTKHGSESLGRSAEHGFESSGRSAEHGFTLIEMLVALVIFSMLAAAGVGMLTFGMRAQDAAAARLATVAGDRRLAALLTADLAQALPRVTRDAAGTVQAAFIGNNGRGQATVMTYVRGGQSGAGGGPQYCAIMLNRGTLERRTRAMPDGAPLTNPIVLAENVTRIDARYRTASGWSDHFADTRAAALPRAAELTIVRDKGAPLTLTFIVGTNYP